MTGDLAVAESPQHHVLLPYSIFYQAVVEVITCRLREDVHLDPSLKGKPVIAGARPEQRGMVASVF